MMNIKPETLESLILINDAISVRKERLLYHNKHEQDYFIVSSSAQSVSIVAVSDSGDILVTREYRHAIGKFAMGFAGGLVDDGEEPIDAARRELLEETGCTAECFEIIGTCYPLPGILAQKMTVVLARGAKITQEANLEASENIQASFISKNELERLMMHEDTNVDGVICTALYYYSLLKVKFQRKDAETQRNAERKKQNF